MLKAIDFIILRDVIASSRIRIPMERQPIRVATLIDEAAFNVDHAIIHNRTVFLEDRIHDWNWQEGIFRYYTRTAEKADVLVVYEEAEVEPIKRFDPMTGERL